MISCKRDPRRVVASLQTAQRLPDVSCCEIPFALEVSLARWAVLASNLMSEMATMIVAVLVAAKPNGARSLDLHPLKGVIGALNSSRTRAGCWE